MHIRETTNVLKQSESSRVVLWCWRSQ